MAAMLLQAQRKAYYSDELLELLISVDDLNVISRHDFWKRFSDRMTLTIQQIIEFAKLIPGFSALSQDDQIMVLKGGKKIHPQG